jgi:hypothetical protein
VPKKASIFTAQLVEMEAYTSSAPRLQQPHTLKFPKARPNTQRHGKQGVGSIFKSFIGGAGAYP